MERNEVKKELCDHLLKIITLKCGDITNISSSINVIYITSKTKQFSITVEEEEFEDTAIDYDFEF